MQTGQPSRTALSAASHRAAHQVLDNASIFADPLALRILKDDVPAIVHAAEAHPSGPRIRWFIAARSRLTEQSFAMAAANGLRSGEQQLLNQ